MSTICPTCKMESYSPMDIKFSWCANCDAFHYAFEGPRIQLNHIISDLQKAVRGRMGEGDPFSLQFEQFTDNAGIMCWRSLIKLGNRVWKTSTRMHTTPVDALCELSLLVEEKA